MEALFLWINERRVKDGKSLIAIDGKTMRGTGKTALAQALHIVSAYDVGSGVALYQKATESKGKEGPVGREIITLLALENAIVTMDALHCQVETLNLITHRKGDFVVGVKNNQKQLFECVKAQFSSVYDTGKFVEFTEKSQGHGRPEQRTVMQIRADFPDDLKKRWPSIRSLIEVVSERGRPGDIHRDSRWYVSSLPLNAEVAAGAIRQHWGIENQLHWVLDVVFREDELSLNDPDGAAHMALFNRVALSVIKQHSGLKDSMASKRRRAAWSADFRSELVFG